ncbi:C45 family peptidase [Actinoalloteichus sp. GBA129-24]|uniref:C45 family peptidase n=1 Tax=Actinoalloteichus sp. GBA129-24 TaxID=1612551 RepID=UPI0009508E19|nr:C45 family peptidase [Actinoalloteichus sp. GBA129-24]APU18456.1 Acyl-coenzyme A:6-aminopenicillanic acid acyl-transferase [Actinoalloteichus sp. GBA129-24]
MNELVYRSTDARLTVRHVRLSGTNEQIGESLGDIARSRYGVSAQDLLLPEELVASRREWASRHYPELLVRGAGIARSFGLDPSDPRVDALGVGYNVQLPVPPQVMGCSVVATPTTDAGLVVQRNFDFGFLSLPEMILGPGAPEAPAMLSEPYLMEVHPTDGGMSALFMCAFDLCNGVIDGINEAGLVVSMMQLIDQTSPVFAPPAVGPGLNEFEVLRFILDRCRTVQDAQRVFEEQQPYLSWLPCHYVIADAGGAVMLAEPGDDNVMQIRMARGEPMCSTNHSLLRPLPDSAQNDPEVRGSLDRLNLMETDLIVEPAGSFTSEHLASVAEKVAVSTLRPEDGSVLGGTLWSSSYRPEERTLSIRYWSGPGEPGGCPDFSPEMHFELASAT